MIIKGALRRVPVVAREKEENFFYTFVEKIILYPFIITFTELRQTINLLLRHHHLLILVQMLKYCSCSFNYAE